MHAKYGFSNCQTTFFVSHGLVGWVWKLDFHYTLQQLSAFTRQMTNKRPHMHPPTHKLVSSFQQLFSLAELISFPCLICNSKKLVFAMCEWCLFQCEIPRDKTSKEQSAVPDNMYKHGVCFTHQKSKSPLSGTGIDFEAMESRKVFWVQPNILELWSYLELFYCLTTC